MLRSLEDRLALDDGDRILQGLGARGTTLPLEVKPRQPAAELLAPDAPGLGVTIAHDRRVGIIAVLKQFRCGPQLDKDRCLGRAALLAFFVGVVVVADIDLDRLGQQRAE